MYATAISVITGVLVFGAEFFDENAPMRVQTSPNFWWRTCGTSCSRWSYSPECAKKSRSPPGSDATQFQGLPIAFCGHDQGPQSDVSKVGLRDVCSAAPWAAEPSQQG